MTETIAERLTREETERTAGFADYLATNADVVARDGDIAVAPKEAPMTQRFSREIADILTPAPEPTKTAKIAAAASAFSKRNSSILTFVAGLLAGSILTIVSGLIR